MIDKMPCLPVKVTDKKWADSLQDGSVFMRSMYDYGSWSAIERYNRGDDSMKSGVQGDVREGLVRIIDPIIGDEFLNLFPNDLKAVMKKAYYVDTDRYQYYKIFCMYGLTFFTDKNEFERPDSRIKAFGDSAVIIYNPFEFANRVEKGLFKLYGDNINFKVDEVHYYPYNYYGDLDEFCKEEGYAWQNEMRMRVALLDESDYILDAEGRKRKALIQDTNSIIVNVGDIRDISIQIPVQDLINLNLPSIIQPPIG